MPSSREYRDASIKPRITSRHEDLPSVIRRRDLRLRPRSRRERELKRRLDLYHCARTGADVSGRGRGLGDVRPSAGSAAELDMSKGQAKSKIVGPIVRG
jgi:hypothetical protein